MLGISFGRFRRNCCQYDVHRDYQNVTDPIVKILDQKMEFYNPGGLGNGLTIDELYR